MRHPVLAGATAALLLLGAEVGAWWLAWLVCAPFAIVWPRRGTRGFLLDGAIAGSTFGLVAAVGGEAGWLAEAARRYFDLAPLVAIAASIALTLSCGAIFGSALGIVLQRWLDRPGWIGPIGAAATWCSWEALLVIAFPYYPWVSLASTQHEATRILQVVCLVGQAGLSFAIAGAGFCFGRAISGRRWGWLGSAIAIALLVSAFGTIRLRLAPEGAPIGVADSPSDAPRCRLAAVDASIESPELGEAASLERYAARSETALQHRPSVVVWPESALVRDPHSDDRLRSRLGDWSTRWDADLLVGAPHTGWSADWRPLQFNSLILVPPAGPLLSYDKRMLVPFAEYWPLGSVVRPAWLADDVSPGQKHGLLRARGCALGVLVCFEANRPDLAAELAAEGAQAIVVATNEAELPAVVGGIELAQARLRAVETGLPLLRAANRGESAAIDRYGQLVESGRGGVVILTAGSPDLAPAARWQGIASVAFALLALAGFLPGRRGPQG